MRVSIGLAMQLNSTRRRVEFICVVEVSIATRRRNSTQLDVELSCVAINGPLAGLKGAASRWREKSRWTGKREGEEMRKEGRGSERGDKKSKKWVGFCRPCKNSFGRRCATVKSQRITATWRTALRHRLT